MASNSSSIRALLIALATCGCSSTVGPSDAAEADAARDVTGVLDGPADRVQCGPGAPMSFPVFDATCAAHDDCATAMHTVDCCGSLRAIGIRRSEAARFAAAEAACSAMFPACGCASNSLMTDDGTATQEGLGAVGVECRAGRCTTLIRVGASCGGTTCGASQICVPGCCGTPGCMPPAPRCVTVPQGCSATPGCGCFPGNPCPTGSCVSFARGELVCVCA